MPRGEFKHRYWVFAYAPNIAGNYSRWNADSYRLLKYRGGCTIALFQLSVWCEKLQSVSQPDTMPLFANSYWFQMTEIGFAELF
jgi:hypothetical protein